MRILPIAAVAAVSMLAACATTPTGKTQVSAAQLAADLNQGANVIVLATALYANTPNAQPVVIADMNTAHAAVVAVANSLSASGVVTGDMAANVTAANAAMNAAIAGVQAVDPATAAKLTADRAALIAFLNIYNQNAPAAGLPVIPNLPAS